MTSQRTCCASFQTDRSCNPGLGSSFEIEGDTRAARRFHSFDTMRGEFADPAPTKQLVQVSGTRLQKPLRAKAASRNGCPARSGSWVEVKSLASAATPQSRPAWCG